MIDKKMLKAIRVDIDNALKSVGEKYGVVLVAGSASYSPTNATMKLAINLISDGGAVITQEEVDYKKYAKGLFDLPADGLGKVFTTPSGEFKITGLKPNSPKYPLLVERLKDGRAMKMGAGLLKLYSDTLRKAGA